ncbi:MAG TPA: GNAT family N-acetyltransferase [Mycobacterium sp.]|nr:GNAT family N-acetyltransferase [Mycobacterium sp.]
MASTTRSAVSAAGRTIEASGTRDRRLLRTFLEQDRVRAGYAICDLDPAEFPRTRWGVAREGGQPISVVLEYLGLTPQPLFVMGDSAGIAQILRDVVRPRLVYLASDHSHVAEIGKIYRIDPGPPMIRMVATRATFRPHQEGTAMRLLPVEITDLNRLYGLGFTSWLPSDSIASGVYYGVRVNGRLVAAAGTHVISREARLAAVGNVMTAPDFRGKGFAKLATSAVTSELLGYCDEVVLNVRSDNPPAIAAYTAIGYKEHNRFEERLAHRRGAPWDSIVGQLRQLIQARKELS